MRSSLSFIPLGAPIVVLAGIHLGRSGDYLQIIMGDPPWIKIVAEKRRDDERWIDHDVHLIGHRYVAWDVEKKTRKMGK